MRIVPLNNAHKKQRNTPHILHHILNLLCTGFRLYGYGRNVQASYIVKVKRETAFAVQAAGQELSAAD